MKSAKSTTLVHGPGTKVPPFWKSAINSWNRFWFQPADPTILGVMRIGCGLIALYTIMVYTLELQNFFGVHAVLNLDLRTKQVHEYPHRVNDLNWPPTEPKTPEVPNAEMEKYAQDYMKKYGQFPPLPWPKNAEEAKKIDDYIAYWHTDPREAHAIGLPVWSIWFHVTDPNTMLVVHLIFVLVTFLFTIGLGTRVTSVLAWFATLCYIHRSHTTVFGVDTMMVIVMMYLMIGPSGAALSVDRLLARWWRSRRRNREADAMANEAKEQQASSDEDQPRPSVTANVAIRLLQIHLCIIYASAGLGKLKGTAWWSGEAIWGTIANWEFAPMSSPLYMWTLETLTANQLILGIFLVGGTYFTLFFEISYAFLIWNKHTRWLMLFMAVVLHGLIGLIMGLKTFSLMMLVMNAVFLPTSVVYWLKDMLTIRKLKSWLAPVLMPEQRKKKAAAAALVSSANGAELAVSEKELGTAITPRDKRRIKRKL